MAELYLTLVSGRTVHVCSDWDGLAPTRIGTVDATGAPDDGQGIEAGEYYRDIFRVSHNGSYAQVGAPTYTHQSVAPGIGTTQTELISPYLGAAMGVKVSETLTDKSDDAAHEKPRGWQKVSTWLVFTGTAGTYQWRAASVDGWSSKAPID